MARIVLISVEYFSSLLSMLKARGRTALFVLLACGVWLVAGTSNAAANSKYAAFVVHADTGDVLFDRYSEESRYPASLTKMMTLYILFEALERGELTLNTRLRVSKRASEQPASRLGLKRGSSITVETAIEALIIRSANDVATVVAEHFGRTETRFAQQMTAKARALGMTNTVFRNASGLPDSRQLTTAADMAVLARRTIQDFPQYFPYFNRTTFTWNGQTYKSHNKVTRTLEGADGLKTGYTRASGYNLATTVKRGDHRLIGIVLGGRSGSSRNAHMEDLINKAFHDISVDPGRVKPILYAQPMPRLRPDRSPNRKTERMVLAAVNTSLPKAPTARFKTELGAPNTAEPALNMASLEAAIREMEAAGGARVEPSPIGEGDVDLTAARTWAIQVGAFRSQNLAIARIHETQDIVRDLVDDVGREVNIAQRRREPVFRARFTRLTEREAQRSCAMVIDQGGECLPLNAAN